MEISSHRCQNDCFFFFLKTFSVGKAVEKLTLYVCLSTLNVSIVLIKLCNPGVKSRLSLSGVQVQSLTWELWAHEQQHSQQTNSSTKTTTKTPVWSILMPLFILGVVSCIFSLLCISVAQCSSVFNEPRLKGFLLYFLFNAYLLY